jgi:hypothetical protein
MLGPLADARDSQRARRDGERRCHQCRGQQEWRARQFQRRRCADEVSKVTVRTIAPNEAVKPLSESECPLVKK